MCYVSAEGRSRDAREDEVLVVARQPHGSNWLVSPEDRSTAVCLKEGTMVELFYIPEQTQRQCGLPKEARATFKMNWWCGDMFVFENGRKVPLKKLQQGQVVRVLSRTETAHGEESVPENRWVKSVLEPEHTRHHIFSTHSR